MYPWTRMFLLSVGSNVDPESRSGVHPDSCYGLWIRTRFALVEVCALRVLLFITFCFDVVCWTKLWAMPCQVLIARYMPAYLIMPLCFDRLRPSATPSHLPRSTEPDSADRRLGGTAVPRQRTTCAKHHLAERSLTSQYTRPAN